MLCCSYLHIAVVRNHSSIKQLISLMHNETLDVQNRMGQVSISFLNFQFLPYSPLFTIYSILFFLSFIFHSFPSLYHSYLIHKLYPKSHHSSQERVIYGRLCYLLPFPNPTTCPLSNLKSIHLIYLPLLLAFLLSSIAGAFYRLPWPS